MKHLKTLCAAATLLWGAATTSFAQEKKCEKDYKPYPYMFVGLQGGVQSTLTNYDFGKLITPTASVSFGSYFTPAVGARLHVNGWMNRGGFKSIKEEYDYNYITTDVDVLLNLTNLFSRCHSHRFNVILLGGIGLNYAWDNDDLEALKAGGKVSAPLAWKDNRLSHNARVGVQFDVNLSKHWGVNLEIDANSLSDRYNSKTSHKDDWQMTAQLGVAYKFGFKKKPVEKAPVEEPVEEWATRIDTTWYDDVTYRDVPVEEKLEKNIYYNIRQSDPKPETEIEAIVNFIKSHSNCKVSVVGYADKGTGTPKLNMKYSKQRTDKTVKALTEKGVDASIITSEAKGDTVQPFSENDRNRVVITVTTGQGVKKEKVVTKKFRTEEVRYRVK